MVKSELITNRTRAKQLSAFDGMQYGLCRPTDIDLSLDFQQKCFVFAELKGGTASLTKGQKIHLMGLVNAIVAGGKQAFAILAQHDTPNPEHDIMVSESIVDCVYCGITRKWEIDHRGKTLDNTIQLIYDAYQAQRNQK
jgi:hypothetical protein